jgi:hypothetical protein
VTFSVWTRSKRERRWKRFGSQMQSGLRFLSEGTLTERLLGLLWALADVAGVAREERNSSGARDLTSVMGERNAEAEQSGPFSSHSFRRKRGRKRLARLGDYRRSQLRLVRRKSHSG